MRDLHRYLENPFDDPGISLDELFAFTTDHLQRMIANDAGGEFAARITATSSSLQLVQSSTTSDVVQKGVRKARKQAKDTFRAALPGHVAKLHAVVVAKYGPNAPEVAECFPQGRTVFGHCTDDQVETHLQALKQAVTAHQADLGLPAVTDANALVTNWAAVYGTSEASSGAKTSSQEGLKYARENLQLMLFLNLLTIALKFPRQPSQLDLFMQQSLLEDHPAQPEEPTPPPPPPPPA